MDNPDDVTVYRMGPGCDLSDVGEGKVYIGRVQGFANFGTFVQLNDRVKGLVHKSNVKTQHKERETILVRVRTIRPNGNIDLEEVTYPVYTVEMVERKSSSVLLAELSGKVGKTVMIEGEIAQIKQTSGPTIFTVVDESGTENAAAFVEAGVRAYPEAELEDIVRIVGEVMLRNNQIQIEVESLSILSGTEEEEVKERIANALEKRAKPEEPASVHPNSWREVCSVRYRAEANVWSGRFDHRSSSP
jgi:RecJ-like exonuclease